MYPALKLLSHETSSPRKRSNGKSLSISLHSVLMNVQRKVILFEQILSGHVIPYANICHPQQAIAEVKADGKTDGND